ncbi:MAG TPA: amylosucrase [Treponema sp.]|nr:amylosucrase [Treponema sp.]
MEKIWKQLAAECSARWEERGLTLSPEWPEFRSRLDTEFVRLAELFWSLYGNRPDFAYRLERLIEHSFRAYEARPARLKARDRDKPPESLWHLSGKEVGAVAYADLFAGSFARVADRIPYLRELGVTYLHLMPFFRSPEKENDGGYAVSSYRETNPALGSMGDLEALAATLDGAGIALVADFVFNHTSDEHEWALKARSGDLDFQDYYWVFPNRADTEKYQRHLRDIFPEVRSGSFTFDPEMNKWVWTTFNSFQWDLNYRNPAVFDAMSQEMISLANRGIAVLRLDAVAFIWKEEGTNCENLEQAHTIIRAFQAVCRLACPSLLFKSEAIVHPDDIEKYVDPRECQLSYNPLLMAELWEAAATKEVRLLAHSLRKRHRLPQGCAWINYVRCHDDIGWTFADEDAAELGIKGGDHRRFLNSFYLGDFPGSFSRGLGFQFNPATGDLRICGTAASLAGVERAATEGRGKDLDAAIRRVLLLYGIVFSAGGLPLIYLGDELGALNRYEYEKDASQAADSRWVHRPHWSSEQYALRKEKSTVAGRIFEGLTRISACRRANPVFGEQSLAVAETGHPSVLAFHKQRDGVLLAVIGNFSDAGVDLPSATASALLAGRQGRDLLSGRLILPHEDLALEACDLLWVLVDSSESAAAGAGVTAPKARRR